MPSFLDTRETSQRFGKHIEQFCSLLDTNHIRHGSPDDLFEFAEMLESNNLFRLDLSALVKSVVQKERDELLLTDMTSIIAASVGGPLFADTHVDLTQPTNTIMEFLMGTGCWKQFGSPSPATSQKAAPPPLRAPVRMEEPRPSRTNPVPPAASIVNVNPVDKASLLDASSELRQTLTRLEINTLQVKLHLESIEQRISKIEPPSDAVPTATPPSPESLLLPRTAEPIADKFSRSSVEARPIFEPGPPAHSRAVFSHQPPPAQPLESETDDFSSPTFAYDTEKRNYIPIGVFLVLAAIVVALLLFAHSGHGQTLLQTGMSRLERVRAFFSSTPETASDAPTAASPSTPAPASAFTVAPKNKTGSTPTRSAASASAGAVTSPDTQTISSSRKLRYVSANVMEGNLLSAPRPEYPPRARVDHIEGQVVMQATISRSGSIKTLHVINGPQSLRSAAINAVRHWRYRPYSVDGRPMEVATTVYVNFSLKPPPAIAH